MRLLLLFFVSAMAAHTCAEDVVSPTLMRRIASDMLRDEAIATTAADKATAIVALCDTYVAIRMHPSYEQSEILHGEGARVRRRLITTNRKLTDQLDRDHIAKPSGLSRRVDAVLPTERPTGSSERNSDSSEHSSAARNDGFAGGAAPGGADESWALVELIQRTIRPDFWEVTGGPGTIRYFAIRRVLVVRATTQVHEELAALLRSL